MGLLEDQMNCVITVASAKADDKFLYVWDTHAMYPNYLGVIDLKSMLFRAYHQLPYIELLHNNIQNNIHTIVALMKLTGNDRIRITREKEV